MKKKSLLQEKPAHQISLRAEVMNNQLSVQGARNATIAAKVRKEFQALFYPAEER